MSDLIERTMQIDTDEQMGRHYIPVALDWEIQTKGKGSSFRIAQRTEDGNRWLVGDTYLHKMLEQMARDINAESVAKADRITELEAEKSDFYMAYRIKCDAETKALEARITELEAENTTLLDLHSKAMKSLTSQVLKRRELEAANAKMRKALLGLLKFHQEGDDGAELPREFWSGNYLDAVEAAEEVLK